MRRSLPKAISHDDQLSVVGHLDELRTRLFVSLAALAVAFGFCFWQNQALLNLINAPLSAQTQQQVRDGHGPLGSTYSVQLDARDVAVQLRAVVGVLAAEPGQPQAAKGALANPGTRPAGDEKSLSAPPRGKKPITLGIGEPFTTT